MLTVSSGGGRGVGGGGDWSASSSPATVGGGTVVVELVELAIVGGGDAVLVEISSRMSLPTRSPPGEVHGHVTGSEVPPSSYLRYDRRGALRQPASPCHYFMVAVHIEP